MENATNNSGEAQQHVHIFKNGLPMQVVLHEISRALGKTDNLTCLDVGVSNGMMAYHLRKLGGKWHSAVFDERTAGIVKEFVSTNVDVISDRSLPFKKKIFDVVVIFDFLERIRDDESFIEECHRILQPDGKIVIVVPNRKNWTFVNILRQMLNMGPEARGWVRRGYSESDLFGILKHGFDVHNMRSFGRFLVEVTDTIVRFFAKKALVAAEPGSSLRRIYSIAGPFYKMAYQLDMLLFLGKGFRLIATAKRRAWRPRNAPILVDGRSISEAVLSKPGV